CGNGKNSKIDIWNFFHRSITFNPLDFLFLRIYHAQSSAKTTSNYVFQHIATRFFCVVGSTYYNYTFGLKELFVDHIFGRIKDLKVWVVREYRYDIGHIHLDDGEIDLVKNQFSKFLKILK